MTLTSGVVATVKSLFSAGLLVSVFLAGWAIQGWRKDSVIADLATTAAQAREDAATRLADEIDRVRHDESAARDALQARVEQLRKETTNAQADRDTFIAGVRSGAIGLSVPIAATAKNTLAADAAAAGGSGDEARTELDLAFAERLTAIADEGDNAIRQLNACIDIYNTVREKLNVQAEQSQTTFD